MATTTVEPSAATTRSAAIWPFSQVRLGEQTLTPWLNVVPSDSIATARINQATFTYPLGTVTVDATSADWLDVEQGMMVWIGTTAGAHDVMVTMARLATEANTLHLIGTAGDPGVATRDQVALADDQYVTILFFKPLGIFLSAIRSGVLYKFFDVTYTDEGDDPDPVAQLGKWRQVKIEDNKKATLEFPDSEAQADYAQGGKTINAAGYTWSVHDVPAAASSAIIEGGGATDETAVIQFDPGFYIVKKQITDTGGKTHTAETYVWVNDDTAYPALDNWEIKGDNQDRVGRKMTIVLQGDEPESDVFPGAAFLLYEKQRGNGEVLSPGLVVDTYVGYANDEMPTEEITHGFTQVKLEGPAHILAKIAMATQYIEEVAAPSDWTEVDANLSNPDGIIWYLLQHHCPQMLQLFDYAPLDDSTLRKKTFTFGGRKLWDQLTELAELFLGNIGCASDGTLLLRADPVLMSAADRTALAEAFHWLTDDILEKFVYTQLYHQKVGQVTGYAFSYAGGAVTPLKALWAGAHQGQGVGRPVLNGLLTTSSGGQARLNALIGHYAAQQNSSNPRLSWDALRNLDIADPARMRWHTLTVGSALDPRGRGFDDLRVVPLSVSRKWSKVNQTWIKTVAPTMQPETSGIAAITQEIPVDNGEGSSAEIFIPPGAGISFEDATAPPAPDAGQQILFYPNSDGYGYNTTDGDLATPTYTRQSLGISGTPLQWVENAFTVGAGWLVTTTGLYTLADVHGTLAATLRKTFRGASTLRSIDASFGQSGHVVCYSTYDDGVFETHATDGTTFSAEAEIGSGNIGVPWTETMDFTVDEQGFVQHPNNPRGVYSAGVGWVSELDGNWRCNIQITFAAALITYADVSFTRTGNPASGQGASKIGRDEDALTNLPVGVGTHNDQPDSRTTVDTTSVDIELDALNVGSITIFDAEVQGTGPNTIGGGGTGKSAIHTPGAWLSSRTAGKTFTSSITAGVFDGYQSTDGAFAVYAAMTDPDILPDDGLACEVHVPWQGNGSEDIVYHGAYDNGTPERRLWKVEGTTKTNISPTHGGASYGPWQSRWQIQSYTGNRNKMLVFGSDDNAETNVGAWVSNNAGAAWTNIIVPTAAAARYERGAIAGNNGDTLYLFGPASIGYSADQGATIINKIGNILTDWPAAGTFIGVSGD